MKIVFALMAVTATSQAQRARENKLIKFPVMAPTNFVPAKLEPTKPIKFPPTKFPPTKFPPSDGCECESDYDCKPVCKKTSFYQKKGVCVDGPPTVTPTPAPTPSVTGSGGGCPCEPPLSNIPTECEVELLIAMTDGIVSGTLELNAQWLRLSFHDAGTFNQNIAGEGGANGCLLTDPAMLIPGENDHLDGPVVTLQTLKSNWMAHPEVCVNVSNADMIQFAGFFATVRQRDLGGAPPGVINGAKVAKLKGFEWGRGDASVCDNTWTHNLPGFSAGSGQPIPMRCEASGGEIKDKMMDRNGFTAEEAVALIGAHTIGLVRNTFGSGPFSFAGPWVENGDDNAAATIVGGAANGPMFDNRFHDFLKNDIIENTCNDFASNVNPFTNIFPDWYRDAPNDLDHLDTDIAIAFPPVPGAAHPDFSVFTANFAASNLDFLTKFDLAYDKMSKLGVLDTLSLPTLPCCDTTEGISGTPVLTVRDVLTLFKDVEGNLTKTLSDPKIAFTTAEILENQEKHLRDVIDELDPRPKVKDDVIRDDPNPKRKKEEIVN